MDEVVVVGYGVQKRSDLTGSVSSVSSKVLEAMPVSSAAEAITGRMAGVQVTTSEGGPDAEIKVRVRGGGSITQDNSPLFIVDGFPVSTINDIAPGDIQSIDVLKDASATAIYGARGANGVVIVTTKSGKEGKTSVSLNVYLGWKELANELDVLDSYEYVMSQYELANYKSSTWNDDTSFMRYYGAYGDLELYKNMKTTNWQREIFGRTGFTQNYNASITGGSEKVKYNIGLTHMDDESIMIGSGFMRNNLNAKINRQRPDVRSDRTLFLYVGHRRRYFDRGRFFGGPSEACRALHAYGRYFRDVARGRRLPRRNARLQLRRVLEPRGHDQRRV